MDKSVDKVVDNVDNFTNGINKVHNIRKSYPQYSVENNPQNINSDVNSRKKYGEIYRKIDEIPDEEINLDGKSGLNKGLDMKDRAENENFVNGSPLGSRENPECQKDELNSFEFKRKNEIEVVINGEIAKDKIIPRNAGKLEIKVYLK